MPRPRFEKAEPTLREAVLGAAAREFAAHGYEGASINRILESAGLSKGAFYYYFDDKADLALTVLQHATEELMEAFTADALPEDAASFWSTMKALQRRALDTLRRSPRQTELVSKLGQALFLRPELAARAAPFMADTRQRISGLWKRGQELGAVRSDLPVELLLSVMQGIKEALARVLLPREHSPSLEELERMAAIQWDFFRRVADPTGPREPPITGGEE